MHWQGDFGFFLLSIAGGERLSTPHLREPLGLEDLGYTHYLDIGMGWIRQVAPFQFDDSFDSLLDTTFLVMRFPEGG